MVTIEAKVGCGVSFSFDLELEILPLHVTVLTLKCFIPIAPSPPPSVKCLDCSKMSNTFDPLLDISVDIKSSSSLTKALHHYIKPDLLEGDNCYACPL